ncbi:MAG: hypothetical protein QNJ81_07785 [Acidimicrobiia bacterium]|nr:hypothetical protein [Acidimicrobiia bacterium]
MAALATVCETDGVLGIVAPLALAAAATTALVVDLDPAGPRYPGPGSLAELVEQGPRLDDLVPGRSGVAVLRNGGIEATDAGDVVAALARGWPNVVLRLPRGGGNISLPVVPVIPLLPGGMTPKSDRPAVYQRLGWHEQAPGPALTMPTPARGTVAALLEGRMPAASRWISAWKQVWGMPWV